MGRNTACKRATTQEKNHTIGTPSKTTIMTTETLELLLSKLPEAARKALRVPYIPHNLIAGGELVIGRPFDYILGFSTARGLFIVTNVCGLTNIYDVIFHFSFPF